MTDEIELEITSVKEDQKVPIYPYCVKGISLDEIRRAYVLELLCGQDYATEHQLAYINKITEWLKTGEYKPPKEPRKLEVVGK